MHYGTETGSEADTPSVIDPPNFPLDTVVKVHLYIRSNNGSSNLLWNVGQYLPD
jgi:hypothetical protein